MPLYDGVARPSKPNSPAASRVLAWVSWFPAADAKEVRPYIATQSASCRLRIGLTVRFGLRAVVGCRAAHDGRLNDRYGLEGNILPKQSDDRCAVVGGRSTRSRWLSAVARNDWTTSLNRAVLTHDATHLHGVSACLPRVTGPSSVARPFRPSHRTRRET